ncbi:hypothetical protein FG99_11100 [Pseudomonas sp. AAC]|nr:hypothetical protein FG99_11100 [Pseudomonas sp. AAC]
MGAHFLAPAGREFLGHVEIAQRTAVVVRRHGLIHGFVTPLTATALQQITTDVTHRLARREVWVDTGSFRRHFADGPQHIATQGMHKHTNTGSCRVFGADQILDEF